MSPWVGMLLVPAALAGLIGGLRLYQRLASPHPEVVRKLLHVSMGLICLAFPWLFAEAWPVLTLAGLSVAALLALRWVGTLKRGLGSVVSAVQRPSYGELYFPVGVALVFALSLREPPDPPEGRIVLYVVPVLLLTLADAIAALIGARYGRLRYSTADGVKSAEGSTAFFLCGFFCVHVPVLLFTDAGRAESLLIGLLLAWLAMMFEAIAWGGLDNLVLPLVSFLLLKLYLPMGTAELAARVAVTAVLMGLVLVYRTRTTLKGDALMGAFLVGYVSWALGGWRWLLPPLTLFVCYPLLSKKTEANAERVHDVHAVISATAAGLIWLFLAAIFDLRDQLLFPYTLAFAAELAIVGVVRLRFDDPTIPARTLLPWCILVAWALLFLPYVFAEGLVRPAGLTAAVGVVAPLGLAGVALGAAAFYAIQPRLHDCPMDTSRWVRQSLGAAVGSVVGLLPLYAG